LKTVFVIGIIILFIGTVIIPAFAQNIEKQLPASTSNWLYVGGSGPGNYSTIQDAINASSDGDTVFVFDRSSPYHGNIVVDRSIRVIGEDKNSTSIVGVAGSPDHSAVIISADKVFLSGFTIEKLAGLYAVWVIGNESNITDNIIDDFWYGVYIYPDLTEKDSNKNKIYHNIIKNCFIGVSVYRSSNSMISFNSINTCEMDNRYGGGISITNGDNTVISNNEIRFDGVGIWAEDSDNVLIFFNNITGNAIGISTSSANKLKIIQNNIYLNRERNIAFRDYINQNMSVDNNYWGMPRSHPKIIFGQLLIYLFTVHLDRWNPYIWIDWPIYLHLPKIYIDKNPAQAPYNIRGG